MPEIGFNQIIFLPYGFVFCGYVAQEVSPYVFELQNAHMICNTGGTAWDDLARGEGRDEATFRNHDTIRIGPQFIFSRRWEGDLPSVKASEDE